MRKNKNVQVRCLQSTMQPDGTERLTIYFRNGHVKHMSANKFLDEFINLDELLEEITQGSRWVTISTKHKIQVTEVRIRLGAVFYTIEGVPKEYSHGGSKIFDFKNHFKPELSEANKETK